MLLGGCRQPGDEDLGLHRDVQRSIALDKLAEPLVLLAALRQRGAELDGKLGARGYDITHVLELSSGDGARAQRDRVEQAIHVDTDGKGAFHLVRELGHPGALAPPPKSGDDDATIVKDRVDPLAQGMEAVAIAGRVFVRPRYGHFVGRRPESGELDRLRKIGEWVLGDDLALLAPYLTVEDRGSGSVLGRKTRKLSLSRRQTATPVPPSDDPRQAWRAGVTVAELSGEIEVDAETGAPLRANVEARYTLPRPSAPIAAHLSLKQDARAATAILAPSEVVPTPQRPRPTVERNQLLEGLAAPVGTQSSGARP